MSELVKAIKDFRSQRKERDFIELTKEETDMVVRMFYGSYGNYRRWQKVFKDGHKAFARHLFDKYLKLDVE